MTVIKLPKELLDFYENLEMILKEYGKKIKLDKVDITEAQLEQHLNEGIPLFKLVPSKIDIKMSQGLLQKICALLSEKGPQEDLEVQRIKEVIGEHQTDLLMDYVQGENKKLDHLVKKKDLNQTILEFILECTAKPFMAAYSKLIGQYKNHEEWQRSYCPICGNSARYANIVGQENKRYLECGVCNHQWLFKRLACPYCQNEDHNLLRTMLIEETPNYQIHACEQCKTYIKVFDGREASLEDKYIKDVSTIFLDIIAREHGYKSEHAIN